jgi:enamine deaminase RidA (YjgF/YER057c/UK114 family)
MSGDAKSAVTPGSVRHLNPEALHVNPAFTQAIAVEGTVRTVYVGGQNAVDASGAIIGGGDIRTQARQVFKNLEIALTAGGAKLEHVVKWTIYVVAGQPPQAGFEVFQEVWGHRGPPPAISVLFVSGLANPDFLMEVDAIAVVPQGAG